jgi:peptide/nickel transport system substrate-binding protein
MTRAPGRRLRLATLVAGLSIVAAACSTAAPTTLPSTGAATNPPGSPVSSGPEMYPEAGEVTCRSGDTPGSFDGEEYNGKVKSIEAPDPYTVIFNLCSTDTAFLEKMAFSVFSIYDSAWLEANVPGGTHLTTMNGTGAFILDQWQAGAEIDYSAYDGYWGDKAAAAKAVLRWGSESAQRLNELRSGNIEGMTLVGANDFEAVASDATLQLTSPPAGTNLNTFYLGMNHDVAPWDNAQVREALLYAIDKQRLVDNFYPPGSEVADYFTPCALEFACQGDPFPDFDPQRARDLLAEAGFPDGIETELQFRPAVRGYLPQPPQIAEELQSQLANVGITVTLDQQDDAQYIVNSNTGALHGLFMLGWGADYPEITNFMDYHFGAGCTAAFGACYPEVAGPLTTGGSTTDEAARTAAYAEANTALIQAAPMVPLAHGAFANAYVAGLEVAQASPLSNELLFRMNVPSGGDTLRFMQNSEPGSVFCADETDGEALRACEQSMEGLYGFEINGSTPHPALAESCEPNEDGTVWTCQLREGVKYHDGSDFTAHDVIVSMALQWDAGHPLHKGKSSQFEYWAGLWGDYLHRTQQPPAPE